MSDMNIEILASFNKAKLNFAFPTRTIHIQNYNSSDSQGKQEYDKAQENKDIQK